MKRDLVLAIDPSLFGEIVGSTDSEMLFYLALTFGLDDDPLHAIARAIGFVETVGHAAPHRASRSDDARLHRRRVALGASATPAEHSPSSLFFSPDVTTLRHLHPDIPLLQHLSDTDHAIVSEPLGDLPGRVARGARVHRSLDRGGSPAQLPFRSQPTLHEGGGNRPARPEL